MAGDKGIEAVAVESKVTLKPAARRLDPWRLVFFDTETHPIVPPVKLRSGKSIPSPDNSRIIQDAFGDINGDMVLPNQNINPEVDFNDFDEAYTKYVTNAWGVTTRELQAEAKRLPTFAQSFMAQIYALRTQVSKRLLIAAHNGGGWDFPIVVRQMKEHKFVFPDDMEIKFLDTQFICKQVVKMFEPKSRKWNLGYVHELVFKETIPDQHTAQADVQALARIVRWWAQVTIGPDATEGQAINALFEDRGIRDEMLVGVVHPTKKLQNTFTAAKLHADALKAADKKPKEEEEPKKEAIAVAARPIRIAALPAAMKGTRGTE